MVVVLALATWGGASTGWPVPRSLGLALCVLALAVRRPVVLALGSALLAAGLAAAATAGLAGAPRGPVEGWATLVGDPVDVRGAVRVDVRMHGAHLEAWSRGAAAAALRPRLAGEQVELRGSAAPLHGRAAAFGVSRHVGARLTVASAGGWRAGSAVSRIANHLRRHLDAGARPLPPDERNLVLGVAIGDDRAQTPETTDAFRRAGISHLLAVSGENVAFALVVVGPFLRRLRSWPRWAATLAVLLLFAVVTRWEPSVLRAVAMATLAVTALSAGRPASRLRLLGLAVTLLLLLDPLLVHSVGFCLSVGATLGITLLAPGLTARLPLPGLLAQLVAVTIAAQVGVAPVALTTFGSIPLVSIPANALAVPPAGFLTAWGLSAVVLAGGLQGPLASLLRAPAGVAAWWIGGVARRCASLPLGRVTLREAVGLAVLGGAVAAWRWWRGR
jgi:competence protein ComEC